MANDIDQELFQKTMIECWSSLASDVNVMKNDVLKMKKDIQLIKTFIKSTKTNVGTIQELAQKYEYDIPFKTAEDFLKFDEELETNMSLKKDVKTILQYSGIHASVTITKSITPMLKMFLTKETAGKFVASRGVPNKYIMKKTNFFLIMEELIKHHRQNLDVATTDKEMNQALSNVLSNYNSWYKAKSFTNISGNTEMQLDYETPTVVYLPVVNEEDLIQNVSADDSLDKKNDEVDDEDIKD